MQPQLYIGTPNAVILCIDSIRNCTVCGRMYHLYSREAASFSSWKDALKQMEGLYNSLDCPRPANIMRSFVGAPQQLTEYIGRKDWTKVMSDDELLNQHGYLDTFIVRVQHRENSTWQGRITWADKNKTLSFRSVWEMVHLMEEAISSDAPAESIDPRQWDAAE